MEAYTLPINNVPRSIRDLPIWTPSHTRRNSKGELKDKAPHLKSSELKHLSFMAAKDLQQELPLKGIESKYLGVCPKSKYPYIFLDYDIAKNEKDHKLKHKEISEEFKSFIAEHPTYIEASVSGQGRRLIYKLAPQDYETAIAADLTSFDNTDTSAPFTGEVFFGSGYVIMTGDTQPESSDISTITIKELAKLIPNIVSKTRPVKAYSTPQISDKDKESASFRNIRDSLLKLPCTMNYYTRRAYETLPSHTPPPNDYTFWVDVANAVAYAALLTSTEHFAEQSVARYGQMFHQWSAGHDTYNERDCQDKWEYALKTTKDKVANGQEVVTHKLLHALANGQHPAYTVRAPKKSGGEVAVVFDHNTTFREIIDFHNLKFRAHAYNIEASCVECHKDVAKRIFPRDYNLHKAPCDTDTVVELLDPYMAAREVLSSSGLTRVPDSVARNFNKYTTIPMAVNDTYDPFKAALLQQTPWQEGEPTIDDFVDTIIQDPTMPDYIQQHCREVMRRCLLYLVGVRFRTGRCPAPCVPILFGKERTYKTTWVREILLGTGFEEELTVDLSSFLSQPDRLSRALTTGVVYILDEIETKLRNADAVKDMLLEDNIDYHRLNHSQRVRGKRLGVIFGTTNSATMAASDNNNRRYCRIAVELCDTTKARELSSAGG